MSFELASHQQKAISKLKSGKILVGDVGSGKSITALSFFKNKGTKDIYVITTAKKRNTGEWFGDAMKMSLPNNMFVDSWNNISKYEDVVDCYFIFDEQKLVGKGAWTKSFQKIAKRNKWILLSATPADVWMDLAQVFIANGFYGNITQFNNRHVRYSRFSKYPKVEGYYEIDLLKQLRDEVYVEMPYAKKAVRKEHLMEVSFDMEEQKLLYVNRWNLFESKPVKDAAELMRLLRKSTNSHWSRYEQTKSICLGNNKTIIFYNNNYELDILRKLAIDLDIRVAEWNGHKHEEIPNDSRWIYLVQYQAGSEGWNCIETDTIIFYSLPYSYKNYEQAKGRIDRMDTPFEEVHYYTLKSRSIIDQGIWRALNRKKNFQQSAFAQKTWLKQ